jgi:hypothetical protein
MNGTFAILSHTKMRVTIVPLLVWVWVYMYAPLGSVGNQGKCLERMNKAINERGQGLGSLYNG